MAQMKAGVGLDLATRQRYKRRLLELRAEAKRLQHLVLVSRPCQMQSIVKVNNNVGDGGIATATDRRDLSSVDNILKTGFSVRVKCINVLGV